MVRIAICRIGSFLMGRLGSALSCKHVDTTGHLLFPIGLYSMLGLGSLAVMGKFPIC